jgi:hypothetical protein
MAELFDTNRIEKAAEFLAEGLFAAIDRRSRDSNLTKQLHKKSGTMS